MNKNLINILNSRLIKLSTLVNIYHEIMALYLVLII